MSTRLLSVRFLPIITFGNVSLALQNGVFSIENALCVGYIGFSGISGCLKYGTGLCKWLKKNNYCRFGIILLLHGLFRV